MPRIKITTIAVAATGLALGVVAAFVFALWPGGASGNPEPWPAFSMRYTALANEQPDKESLAYQTWELDYASSRSWTKRLVADDVYVERVGSWESFDGKTYTKFNALANTTTELPAEPDAVAVPDRWLVPKTIGNHQKAGYERDGTSDVDGGAVLERSETVSCTDGNAGSLCPAEGAVEVVTRMTVDAQGIPSLVTETIDGREVVVFRAEKK